MAGTPTKEEMHDIHYFPKSEPGKVCHNQTPEFQLENEMFSFEFSRRHIHDITRIGIMLSTGAIIVESPLHCAIRYMESYSVTCMFRERLIGNYTTPHPPEYFGKFYEFICAKTGRIISVYGDVDVECEKI